MKANLKAIKMRLIDLDLKQFDAAKNVGIVPPLYSAIVNDRLRATPELREKIAKSLNCKVTDIFENE